MRNNQNLEPEVKSVLDRLIWGQVSDDMYDTIRKYQNKFLQIGITPYDLKELLELNKKVMFVPDALSYSLNRPGRGEFILAEFDHPSFQPIDDNEKRFAAALHDYYQHDIEYKQKLKYISEIAKEQLYAKTVNRYYTLSDDDEVELLMDILQDKDIDQSPFYASTNPRHFLTKFDLYDAYCIDDSKVTLKWKVGKLLESKGFLDKGLTERLLKDAGVSVDELQDGINRHKVDKLRVSGVPLLPERKEDGDYIRCWVDGVLQSSRKISDRDAKLLPIMKFRSGIVVKYYADVLEKNKKEGRMVADEKTLARMSMPYVDRLLDIYKHGMNEQDVMLLKASQTLDIDLFWWHNGLLELGEHSVEIQKKKAFARFTGCLSDLRPGMLTDEGILSLVGKETIISSGPGRKGERNLMKLPECFFLLVEQSEEFDQGMIDYVKVLRGLGRVTPTMALNSIHYYLSNRLLSEWDPEGIVDCYGVPIGGCYYHPNINMKNPMEKFPSNLLSEEQWEKIIAHNAEITYSDLRRGAFKRDRVTDIQIYPCSDGNMAIRCKVDNVQQEGRLLSADDVRKCNDYEDKLNLAVSYFIDAFAKEPERCAALVR